MEQRKQLLTDQYKAMDFDEKIYTVHVYQIFLNLDGETLPPESKSAVVTWDHGHVQGHEQANWKDDDHVEFADALSGEPIRLTRI